MINSLKLSWVKRWIIMIALQQWLFASWSFIFMMMYMVIGKVIFWFDLVYRFLPQHYRLFWLSGVLIKMNNMLRFPSSISGGVFFAIVFVLAFTLNHRFHKGIVLCLVAWLLIQPYQWLPQIHFINVGQGHATLVQYRNQSVLIDTGKKNHVHYLKHFLYTQRVNSLDALLITHDDEDHSGGVEYLLKEGFAHHVHPHKASWISSWSIDSLLQQRFETSSNEDSAIYLVQLPQLRVLITGDAYHQQERCIVNAYHDLHVDVYLAGHHGSKTSSHPDFVSHIKPSLAIIAAQSAIYGHPHLETRKTFQQFQIPVLELEHHGDITIYVFPWFKLVLSSQKGFAIMK